MRRGAIVLVTVAAYAALYAPQPLLPLFAERYGVARSTAALLVTATLLPLSVAPLSYGALLQRVSPTRVLRASVLALAASELAFALADAFWLLLGIRLLQGVLLPAVFTSAMTHVARSAAAGRVQRDMSGYIAASIVGGYLGRLLSSLAAEVAGWRAVFVGLAVVLGVAGALLGRPAGLPTAAAPPTPSRRALAEVLRTPSLARVYALVFCVFFVFAGLLNFLPFRVAELSGRAGSAYAGLIYTGYLMGVATSLGSGRISARSGGDADALRLALGAYLGSLLLMLAPRMEVLFVALFAFCGAMFLVHALAAGMVNRAAGERAGVVNGLYLVCYYSGGVLGSYLPGLAYERLGWGPFVGVLAGVTLVGAAVAASLARPPTPSAAPPAPG